MHLWGKWRTYYEKNFNAIEEPFFHESDSYHCLLNFSLKSLPQIQNCSCNTYFFAISFFYILKRYVSMSRSIITLKILFALSQKLTREDPFRLQIASWKIVCCFTFFFCILFTTFLVLTCYEKLGIFWWAYEKWGCFL